MATDVSELPLFTHSVDKYDTFPEVADSFRIEGYNYEDDIDPYNIVISDFPPIDYEAWEEEQSKTYAGIYIDDITMANLFTILTGRGGYFMLRGVIMAEENGHPVGRPSLTVNALDKARRQMDDMILILNPLLESAGVPWDKRSKKTDEIIDELRARYSGEQNKKARQEEKIRLGIGKIATSEIILKKAS